MSKDLQLSLKKPVHIKPSLYAYYFESLKEIAKEYGYNLVLHGSLNRDLDLIAIPWEEKILSHESMIHQFAEILGGFILPETKEQRLEFAKKFHGRINYIININRQLVIKHHGMGKTEFIHHSDPQYYIDISVLPTLQPKPNN